MRFEEEGGAKENSKANTESPEDSDRGLDRCPVQGD